MTEHIFSNDPFTPLNKKIREISHQRWEDADHFEEKLLAACREIYAMGFDDGENHVWQVRSLSLNDPAKQKWIAPGDPGYPREMETIATDLGGVGDGSRRAG